MVGGCAQQSWVGEWTGMPGGSLAGGGPGVGGVVFQAAMLTDPRVTGAVAWPPSQVLLNDPRRRCPAPSGQPPQHFTASLQEPVCITHGRVYTSMCPVNATSSGSSRGGPALRAVGATRTTCAELIEGRKGQAGPAPRRHISGEALATRGDGWARGGDHQAEGGADVADLCGQGHAG